MLSSFAPWCAEACISASEGESQKPHQGFAGQNPTLHRGIEWSKSTLALGLPEWSGKTASGPAVAANNGTPKPPQPPKPKCSITDKLNAANKKAVKLFLRDMAVGEGGAFLVGCGIGAPAGAPFGGPIGVIGGCAGGGVAAATAALPLTTFVSGLDASIEAYSGAFSDKCD